MCTICRSVYTWLSVAGNSIVFITEYCAIYCSPLLLCCHRYDVDKSGFIDFMELKLMMEKLGEPQTHLALKAMIKEVDEDNDGEISFREVSGCVCGWGGGGVSV